MFIVKNHKYIFFLNKSKNIKIKEIKIVICEDCMGLAGSQLCGCRDLAIMAGVPCKGRR